MTKEKICPLTSKPVSVSWKDNSPDIITSDIKWVFCEKSNCALWITGYTTERLQISCCAFEFMALKNSDGQYRV